MRDIFKRALTCNSLLTALKREDPNLPVYIQNGPIWSRVCCARTMCWYPGSKIERTAFRLYNQEAIAAEPLFLRPWLSYLKEPNEDGSRNVKDLIFALEGQSKMGEINSQWRVIASAAPGKAYAVKGVSSLTFDWGKRKAIGLYGEEEEEE